MNLPFSPPSQELYSKYTVTLRPRGRVCCSLLKNGGILRILETKFRVRVLLTRILQFKSTAKLGSKGEWLGQGKWQAWYRRTQQLLSSVPRTQFQRQLLQTAGLRSERPIYNILLRSVTKIHPSINVHSSFIFRQTYSRHKGYDADTFGQLGPRKF